MTETKLPTREPEALAEEEIRENTEGLATVLGVLSPDAAGVIRRALAGVARAALAPLEPDLDGIPAPEARVRAYVEAQAEEDNRTGSTTTEIAWAVPEEGGLVALSVDDLRDVLAELAAARTIAEAVDGVGGVEAARAGLAILERLGKRRAEFVEALRQAGGTMRIDIVPGGVEQHEHPANIADVPTEALAERFHALHEFHFPGSLPEALAHEDPRCSEHADGESRCFWDDLGELSDELDRRRG